MRLFPTIQLFASVTCLAILSVASSALASERSEKADVANNLLPLEVRSADTPVDHTLLESVADRINHPEVAPESSTETDVLGAGLVDDFIDENGDVDLPLGLTVFDAMGTTSVGFGGSF